MLARVCTRAERGREIISTQFKLPIGLTCVSGVGCAAVHIDYSEPTTRQTGEVILYERAFANKLPARSINPCAVLRCCLSSPSPFSDDKTPGRRVSALLIVIAQAIVRSS